MHRRIDQLADHNQIRSTMKKFHARNCLTDGSTDLEIVLYSTETEKRMSQGKWLRIQREKAMKCNRGKRDRERISACRNNDASSVSFSLETGQMIVKIGMICDFPIASSRFHSVPDHFRLTWVYFWYLENNALHNDQPTYCKRNTRTDRRTDKASNWDAMTHLKKKTKEKKNKETFYQRNLKEKKKKKNAIYSQVGEN